MKRIIVGISGASGAVYAIRLIEAMLSQPVEIHLIISNMGLKVMAHELKMAPYEIDEIPDFISGMCRNGESKGKIIMHDSNDMFASVASGSFPVHAMVIVPCSMKTLSAVATGYTTNLLERAADVSLKEKRPLILVTRETPLSQVHLKNMLAAHEAGATIMPACPGHYHHPRTIDDLIQFMIGRILDHLGIIGGIVGMEIGDYPRWQG